LDLLCHVLGCIDDPSAEVMGRTAARWCAINQLHRNMIYDEGSWRLLVARLSATVLPYSHVHDSFWVKRVCDSPTIDMFFELCSLGRLQRMGVPRDMVRTAFKVFLHGDGKRRWDRVCRAHGGDANFDVNRKFTFIIEAWERMDPIERNVYHDEVNRMFRCLGFGGYRTLPGVRKYTKPVPPSPPTD
tara:strand:- start:3227 stop:3787 length:561 start_codon:yes stop_codon:yes gene_type:complete